MVAQNAQETFILFYFIPRFVSVGRNCGNKLKYMLMGSFVSRFFYLGVRCVDSFVGRKHFVCDSVKHSVNRSAGEACTYIPTPIPLELPETGL